LNSQVFQQSHDIFPLRHFDVLLVSWPLYHSLPHGCGESHSVLSIFGSGDTGRWELKVLYPLNIQMLIHCAILNSFARDIDCIFCVTRACNVYGHRIRRWPLNPLMTLMIDDLGINFGFESRFRAAIGESGKLFGDSGLGHTLRVTKVKFFRALLTVRQGPSSLLASMYFTLYDFPLTYVQTQSCFVQSVRVHGFRWSGAFVLLLYSHRRFLFVGRHL